MKKVFLKEKEIQNKKEEIKKLIDENPIRESMIIFELHTISLLERSVFCYHELDKEEN